MLEVPEAVQNLEATELAAAYARALTDLTGKQDDWAELRQQTGADPGEFWRPFQRSYDLRDFGWFDEAYFERHGPNLVQRLAAYVPAHKSDFVEPKARVISARVNPLGKPSCVCIPSLWHYASSGDAA